MNKKPRWNGRVLWKDVPHLYFPLAEARRRLSGGRNG